MFDKDLFLFLCEKYNVELSKVAKEPMLREGNNIRPITEEDIKQIFTEKRYKLCGKNFIGTDTKLSEQDLGRNV